MPREIVRMHFAREPRENEPAALAQRPATGVSFLSFFFLCIIEPRDQLARSFTLIRSCMTGDHGCAIELPLIRIVHFNNFSSEHKK